MKQASERDGGGGHSRREEKVPFYKLFSFADGWDIVMMISGTLAAIGSGLSMPLMTVIIGQLINSFAGSNSNNIVHEITKGHLKLRNDKDAALQDAMTAQCVYLEWPTAFYVLAIALAKLEMPKDAAEMLNEAAGLEKKRQRGGRGS